MDISAQPYVNASLSRLRTFMGLLMNHEEALESCSIHLPDTYRFAVEEHDQLEQLKSGLALEATDQWKAQLQAADHSLLQRVSSILAILKAHNSTNSLLGHWLSFRETLRQAAQPDAAIFTEASQSQASTLAWASKDPLRSYHATWSDLELLHSTLMALDLSHDFILPFGIFLGGLGQVHLQKQPVHPPEACSLSLAARAGLESVVDFALQEKAQCLARSRSRIPGDTEYQCLLMGVAHLVRNPTPPLAPWIHQGSASRQLSSALFAMGSLAASERVSFRWTRLLLPRWQMLTEDSFGPGMAQGIVDWARRE